MDGLGGSITALDNHLMHVSKVFRRYIADFELVFSIRAQLWRHSLTIDRKRVPANGPPIRKGEDQIEAGTRFKIQRSRRQLNAVHLTVFLKFVLLQHISSDGSVRIDLTCFVGMIVEKTLGAPAIVIHFLNFSSCELSFT